MSDLIRREELLISQYVHTECYLQENKDRHLDVYKKGWNDALQAVHDNAPRIDAVEVVRCKDCEHDKYCCRIIRSSGRLESDFCSYGERKTDG